MTRHDSPPQIYYREEPGVQNLGFLKFGKKDYAYVKSKEKMQEFKPFLSP